MNSIPAFPCDDIYDHHGKVHRSSGMSLRDYFAAKALITIMTPNPVTGQFPQYSDFDECAKASYKMADSMLKARLK